MKTGDFKRSVSLIAGVVAKGIKHGIKDVVKACNTGRAPTIVEPTEPAPDASVRLQATYTYKMSRYLKELDQWEENNSKLYVRFMLHCSPSMETKLESMAGFDTVKDDLDGLGLIKLLRKAYFEQDGTKQAMLEIVEADKRLMLCWQKPGMTIDAYTRDFKAKIDVCEAVGSAIGASDTTTKLVCTTEGEDYGDLVRSDEDDDMITLARMRQLGQDRYLAALHFEGLNKVRYGALQKRVHEAFLISGNDTMPTRIDRTILMASQHDMERGQDPSAPVKTQPGVICAQQGTLEEHAGDDKDLKAVALAQEGEEGKSVLLTKKGKPVVCFNPKCKGKDENHYLHSCPKANEEERKEILKAIKKKWADEKQANTVVPGQSHAQVTADEIESQVFHQDDYEFEDGLACIQAVDNNSRVQQQKNRETLKPSYLYLDSMSSFNQMFEDKHLEDVQEVGVTLRGKCNAGTIFSNEKGVLLDMFSMWLVRNGIANLLSVPCLEREGCQITYDTKTAWIVSCPNGLKLKFKKDTGVCEGFPYVDLENLQEHVLSDRRSGSCKKYVSNLHGKINKIKEAPKQKALIFIQTVRKNMEGFTKREVKEAHLARKAQAVLGHVSDGEMIKLVNNASGITNLPFHALAVTNAKVMYGKDLGGVRGKTVRYGPERAREEGIVSIPPDFLNLHRFVTLTADIMFVNSAPFMVTFSRKIRLRTVEFIPNRTVATLISSLKKVINLYARGGYIVNLIMMDQEFEKVEGELGLVEINTTAAREHVGEIERSNRVVKERARSISSTLPYAVLPKQIVIHLIYYVVTFLNCSVAENGVSDTLSPREIVLRRKLDWIKHCTSKGEALEFGEYVEAHEDPDITNTPRSRTYPSIYLGPTTNIQGTKKVFDLKTGVVKKPRTVTRFPCPDRVITLVDTWGRRYQKEERKNKLEFLNRKKLQFDWDNDDLDQPVPLVENSVHVGTPAQIPGIELESEIEIDGSAVTILAENSDQEMAAAAANAGFTNTRATTAQTDADNIIVIDDDHPSDNAVEPQEWNVEQSDQPVNPAQADVHVTDDDVGDTQDGVNPEATGLFATPNPETTGLFANPDGNRRSHRIAQRYQDGQIHLSREASMEMSTDDLRDHILGVIMVQQFSLRAGINKFGDKATTSVSKELQQIHDMGTYKPVNPDKMTKEQKMDAMNSLLMISEKRDKKVKSRMVADGSIQRKRPGYKKEDSSAPTVSTEGVFITGAIEAWEERIVNCFDIPGAFLHADCKDGEVYMRLRGKLAELMVLVEPKLYREYVRYPNGHAELYVRMTKALYGMLKSALWFYEKLRDDLEADGFTINDYDPCVANKMVNGNQMTVTWHVDDLKVSHREQAEIDIFAQFLRDTYEKPEQGLMLTHHKGKVHDYLGIDLDYSERKKLKVSMIKYIDKIFKGFSEDIGSPVADPAAAHLFTIREEGHDKYLPEEKAQEFHTIVAQLLFLSGRARRDIQVAVAFLTTRVKKPDIDDWGKLRRVLKYLKGTKYMKLTLTIDNMSMIRWWVDASDRTHHDCKGHTGSMMSLGGGAIVSSSTKHKINTKSSTESELVALDDALPMILWCLYFIEAQGYTVEQNVVFQDNQSTMRLAVNGSLSSTKRTKHIKARYYFIKDKIEEGELDVRYCPTTEMWSDVLNKAKHGTPFKKDRAMLMNVPLAYDDDFEFRNTHPDLLPSENSLKTIETQSPIVSSRSVLGGIRNTSPHEIRANRGSTNEDKYKVTWAGVVSGS